MIKNNLKHLLSSIGIDTEILDSIKNAYDICDFKNWNETYEQIAEDWPDENTFLKSGIMHNIEDAEQLYDILEKHLSK